MEDLSPSEFETRRAELVGIVGDSLEKVLQQINTLNRNLEGIIAIGNEFSAVEALWSQFESVMDSTENVGVAKEPEAEPRDEDRSRTETRGREDATRSQQEEAR